MNFIKVTNELNDIISYNSNNSFYPVFNQLEKIVLNEKIININFDINEELEFFGIGFSIDNNEVHCMLILKHAKHVQLAKDIINSFNL
tara:strand:+ start:28 stop:291 length:264 start_codon:yes stop_codon:yes gene_type:complete